MSKIGAKSAAEETTTHLEPHMLSALLTKVSLAELFATRTRTKMPTLDDYDGKEDWVLWRNVRTHALVDLDTFSRDGEPYAPEPVAVGETFLAPDNAFWRSAAEQGIIERVRTRR